MAIAVPHTFTANTSILSAEVNANFQEFGTKALDKTGDTMTGSLLFTDASFDIGASGATRPRDLFLSRNLTFGGLLTGTGFGSHSIVAGGTGAQAFGVRNSTAGTGNYAAFLAQGDNAATQMTMQYLSDSFTPAADLVAASGRLAATGAGGLSISTTHASGTLRFYTNSTERLRLGSAGALFLNDTANAGMTIGLTLNQGASDDEILAFKSSDVAHGVTTLAETDTWGLVRKAGATDGGLSIQGYTGATAATKIHGIATTTDTTEAGSSNACIQLIAEKVSGTGTTTFAADDNIVVFKNGTSATHIFKGNGDSYQDGTGWTAYDNFDDLALVESVEHELTHRQGKAIDRVFTAGGKETARASLIAQGLMDVDAEDRMYVNHTRLQSLLCGTVRQLGKELQALRAEIDLLKG